MATYTTFDPTNIGTGITLSNGNLTMTKSANAYQSAGSNIGKTTGKWYWEFTLTSFASNGGMWGIFDSTVILQATGEPTSGTHGWGITNNGSSGGTIVKRTNATNSAYGGGKTLTTGDVIGVYMDVDAGTVGFIAGDGTDMGNAFTGLGAESYRAFSCNYDNANVITANFGASAFSHTVPTGYNSGFYTNGIMFDAALLGSASTSTSFNETFTCTGSNLVLIVGVLEDDNPHTATGVTYNSVAMTKITDFGIESTSNVSMSVWFLINPATGSHTLTTTRTGTASCSVRVISYTGANQSLTYTGTPTDNYATLGDTATATSRALAVTTLANNSWVIGFNRTGLVGYATTPGSGTMSRTTSSASGRICGDSGHDIVTAGSYTMNWTNAGADSNIVISLSLSPVNTALLPSVNDTVTVSEAVTMTLVHKPSVFDTVTISESPVSTNTGAISPGTTSDQFITGVAWSNTDNIKVSDDIYATATTGATATDNIAAYNLGFTIPSDATIVGIKVEVEAKHSAGTVSPFSRIAKVVTGSGDAGSNANTTGSITTTEQYNTWGGATDMWGVAGDGYSSWTPADINATSFGYHLRAGSGVTAGTLSIDHVRITVYYITAAGVNIQVASNVSVFDAITVTESVSVEMTRLISVFDSITVTESITALIPVLVPYVFDSVTISEDISISIPLPVFVFDSVATIENVVTGLVSYINVFDSVSVSEVVTLKIDLTTSVFDSITVTESVTVLIPVLVPDVSETVTVTEVNTFQVLSYINVFDSVTVTENFDDQLPITFSVFDAITVTENTTTGLVSYINVFDTATITEDVTLFLPILPLSVFDAITVDENITAVPVFYIDVFDTITVTENLGDQLVTSLSIFDTVTIAETVTVDIQINIDVNDTISVTEDVVTGGTEYVFVFDSIAVSEYIETLIPELVPSVYDTVTVSEIISARTISYLSIYDTVAVSETTTILIPTLVPSVFDTVTVTENIASDTFIYTYDIFPYKPTGTVGNLTGLVSGGGVNNDTGYAWGGSTDPLTGYTTGGSL